MDRPHLADGPYVNTCIYITSSVEARRGKERLGQSSPRMDGWTKLLDHHQKSLCQWKAEDGAFAKGFISNVWLRSP